MILPIVALSVSLAALIFVTVYGRKAAREAGESCQRAKAANRQAAGALAATQLTLMKQRQRREGRPPRP